MKKFNHVDLIVKEGEKTVLYIPDVGNLRKKSNSSPREDVPFDFNDIDFARGVNQ